MKHDKDLAQGPRVAFDFTAGQTRLQAEARRVTAMLDAATPPSPMQAAPVAPARGTMKVEDNWEMLPGGTRRRDGVRWVEVCQLRSMVASAALRHEARKIEERFVPPFTPGQIAVAGDYRALVEWRDGSALRCSSLESGLASGGGGSGLFIDSFIQQGRWLAELHSRIGHGRAMEVRRNMDRGNARRAITVRALVDMVVVGGLDLTAVLVRFGWVANGQTRRELKAHLVAALDRMQGYRETGAQHEA